MHRKMIVGWVLAGAGCGMLAFGWLTSHQSAHAATGSVYVMNSGGLTSSIFVLNPSTMAVTSTLPLTVSNGRGVAVVGSTLYYTTAASANVYSYNLNTSTDNGVLFTVTGLGVTGLDSLAFDGTGLWIADLGSNRAFRFSLAGALLKNITLGSAGSGY